MKRILFLEGNIQIGKSTIILNSLKSRIDDAYIGGFLCQRLTKDRKTKAFRIISTDKAETTAIEYKADMPDVFLEEISGKWIKYENIFRTKGIELLSNISLKRIIFLDEIGGFELLIDEFREKLYEVLKSGIPIIGVIKSDKNGMIMKNTVGLKNDYWNYYLNLRSDIEKLYGGKILNVNKYNILSIENQVKTFLNGL